MSLRITRSLWLALLCGMIVGLLESSAWAKSPAVPSAEDVAELLRREPMSRDNWPTWRKRLMDWFGDTSRNTHPAFNAASEFMRRQANAQDELPASLAKDSLAWYLLANSYLYAQGPEIDDRAEAARAERALRRSIQLDPKFARAHRNLAGALWMQAPPSPPSPRFRLPVDNPKQQEGRQEMELAQQLDPTLKVSEFEGYIALRQKRFGDAETLYRAAMNEEPGDAQLAHYLALAIVYNPNRPGPRAPSIEALLAQFPNDGALICLHGRALTEDNDARAGMREVARARRMGFDPNAVIPPKLLAAMEAEAAPPWWEYALWILAAFAAFYALWMLLMAGLGVILAGRTRGDRALQLLDEPDRLVEEGQVARTRHESLLAKFYVAALMTSLVLFYLSLPFLILGLLGGTGLLLYLIFQMGRIPIKLVVVIIVVGLGGAWAVFKSIFARPGTDSFGIAKTPEQCPRVYEVLTEVAQRVDTEPVDEVYLAPGSAIGVHQEGRGPFGVFGVKRRVLTLGVSTLRFLSVGELRSILAHEYAHFSHQDTFYNRFIYQVTLSIQEALNGMARTGGKLNYVNPFLWFLVLYHKAYNLLSSGFSRSREFLADRMAAGLYGSDVFANALTKVCTDGQLFEMCIYDNIAKLLGEGKAFVNMYEAFKGYRDEQLNSKEREELYQKMLDEKASLFASHPTFAERIAAVKGLPVAQEMDATPALTLCENAEEVEKEMTEFLTGYIYHLQQLQAQAAAAG